MTKLHISRIDCCQDPALEQFEDKTIFQTSNWLKFIAHAQNAEIVTAAVDDGAHRVGRFSGLIVKRMGIKILGSPLPGWTTDYMGFNLRPSVSRFEALLALEDFALNALNCMHVEIMDRYLRPSEMDEAGYTYRMFTGYEIDLTKSEAELFAALSPACRRCIRKADREGIRIEIARDMSFVDEYYEQLKQVFARQNLVPTYPKERVELLLHYLLPTGQLLLLRARDREGRCIATGIFPALYDTMFFWGGASWRHSQHLRPNQAIQWFAIRYWKARNITKYDMSGSGEYKRRYGGAPIAIPWGRKSRYRMLENFRSAAKNYVSVRQRALGLATHWRSNGSNGNSSLVRTHPAG
jgi:hypothetical protein